MVRKLLISLTLLVLLCVGGYFFRYDLLVVVAKSALPKNVEYQEICAADETVTISGLHFATDDADIVLDSARFGFEFQKVFKSPKKLVSLFRSGPTHWTDFLVPIKQYGLNLHVDHGTFSTGGKSYAFQFVPGEKKHEIGYLSIAADRSSLQDPFLTMKFHLRGEQLISQLTVAEVEAQHFFRLAAFALPQYFSGITDVSGTMAAQASIIFEENGCIDEISTRVQSQSLRLFHAKEDLTVACENFNGELNYPEGVTSSELPIWKRMQCVLNLENGSIRYKDQFALSHLEGSMALDSREDPSLSLIGELAGQEEPLVLALKGRGAVHDDHAYWLEFDLGLHDQKGTECGALLSLCRPEASSLVVQVEANQLLPQQVGLLKSYFSRSMPRLNDWEIQEGTFGGTLIALFEEGNLSHFEIFDLIGEQVVISAGKEPLVLNKIHGEGRLSSDLNFTMELPSAHFFGCLSDELREAYADYTEGEVAQVTTTIQYGSSSVNTSASVHFPGLDETVQFGFTSQQPFPATLDDITSGWAASEKLTAAFYGPLIRHAFEDFELYGDIDLIASFDGKQIDCALAATDFLVKHPLVDLKARQIGEKEKTVGRIKFSFDPKNGVYEGSIPLHGVEGYDRTYGLYFNELEGDLQISPKKFTGHVSDASVHFAESQLVKNLSFYFSYDGAFDFQEVRASLALPSSHDYNLYLPKFNRSSCDLHLFDGEKALAHVKGDQVGTWKGTVDLPFFKGSYPAEFSWDPLQDVASLQLMRDDFSLHLVREKGEYQLKELRSEDYSASAAFTFDGMQAQLAKVQLSTKTGSISGQGFIQMLLPTEETPFSAKGELAYQLETNLPIPLKLTSKEPLKWAFSSEMGFVTSGVHLQAGESELQIGQLEKLPTGNISANGVQFAIEEKLLGQVFAKNALPTFLQDFQICQGLYGLANFTCNEGKLQLAGSFESKRGNIDVKLDWGENAGKLTLGREEALTFAAHYENDRLQFDKIEGTLGRLKANLKKHKNSQMKGSVSVDFSLIDQLFSLPLNDFVSAWKAGSGYQLDGVFSPASRLFDWGFKGKIKGNSFECGGYELRSLEAKVEIEPGQITIENLDLTDEAGKLWIGEGALMKGNIGQWIFSFPTVEVRGFQPSFLKKLQGSVSSISPLVLKSATIRNVRGRIDDPRSISGAGELRFTNFSKKKQSKLPQNLPLQFLQQAGLDGKLFVPISGEMDFALQNGRIYLQGIRNMISEQNRSEFTPPRNAAMGYLDFSGNLAIDLLVRQRATRSTPAPLSLHVRGTWHDPQISIK